MNKFLLKAKKQLIKELKKSKNFGAKKLELLEQNNEIVILKFGGKIKLNEKEVERELKKIHKKIEFKAIKEKHFRIFRILMNLRKVYPVIMVFLQRKEKIALFKRGKNVRFPGKWYVIGGFIWGNTPLQQAFKEIREEAGLKKSEVKLLKKGKKFIVSNKKITDKVRVIHPFLFECNKSKLKLDWEHTEYKWVKPEEIKKFDTVPGTKEGLKEFYG